MASARGLLDDLIAQNLQQVAEGNLEPNDVLDNCLVMLGRDPGKEYGGARPSDASNEGGGAPAPAPEVPQAAAPAPAPAPAPPANAEPDAPAPQTISPQGIPPTNQPGVPGGAEEPGIPPIA